MRLPPQPERREDRTRRKAEVRPGTGMEEESAVKSGSNCVVLRCSDCA